MALALVFLASLILFGVPLYRLLPRAGIPRELAIGAVFPIVAILMLWYLAFKRWPGDDIPGRFE